MSEGITEMKFDEFNPRRAMRNAPAASYEIVDDGETFFIWMRESDIRRNLMQFPEFKDELQKGLDSYV